MVERASAEVAATAPSHIIQNWSKDNQRNQQEVRTNCCSHLVLERSPAEMVAPAEMVLERASEGIRLHRCGRSASRFWRMNNPKTM